MTWPYAFIGFLALADSLIGGYIFFKDPSRPLNRAFFAFAFGAALIGAGMVLLSTTHHILFDRVVFAGGYLMVFGLVLLSWKFPEDKPLRPAAWLVFLPLALLAVLTPFGFMVKEVIFRPDGILQPVNGPGIHAFAIVIGAYFILSGWGFWRRYRSLAGTARLQMQYLILGAGVFVFATFICNVLLPALGVFDLNVLGPLSSVAFVAATGYAIVRHRLLDIRVVVQRGMIYLVLLALVTGFYLCLIFATGDLLHQIFDRQDEVFLGVGLLAACVGIFTVPFLERYLRRATDRFFFKDRYRYSQALRNLSAILNQNMETEKIIKRASQALKDTLRTAEARMVLFRERSDPAAALEWYTLVRAIVFQHKGTLILERERGEAQSEVARNLRQEHGIEVIAPIFLGRKPLGAVVLGPKRSGDPYRDEDAELLATFSYQAAVALEKARLFEKVRNHSGELEQRVRERTAELERLQEEQRQMMIDISHRLQTPLTTVKSELEFLKRNPDSLEHTEAFERSIDGISKFIYDLLELARLGVQPKESAKEAVDLSGLLQGLVEYFEVLAEDQAIRLTAQIEPGVSVAGHKEHLEELVMNLVSNAFKYLDPAREKEVTLVLRRGGGQVVLEVKDNGRGITPEDLERIFERFYRGKQPMGDAPAGTGLGLAITKKIVENHGGTIAIESEVGQGTKVSVALPWQNPGIGSL